MRKIILLWTVAFFITTFPIPSHAQNQRVVNKLAAMRSEQLLVFELGIEELLQVIEATAWKMNYDSVVTDQPREKILLIRTFPPLEFQYRILLKVAPVDSAIKLAAQGFWFLAPDSMPRSSKSMQRADRDLLKLFLYAFTQEIARKKGVPLFDRTLPGKPFSKFMGWNLLNPGLASWYLMKDHPRVSQKSAVGWSLFFGALDLGYTALSFAPTHEAGNQNGGVFNEFSPQQIALFGMSTSRLAMTIGYFVDKDYDELKKSGYYFSKIEQLDFNTRYTRPLKQ